MNRDQVAFRLAGAHGLLRFPAWGRSMWPLLRPGDTAIAEPLSAPPREGDIVVYRAGERLVAHRFIGSLPDGRLRLHGDFGLDEVAQLAPDAALGRVVAVERAGRRISLDAGVPRLLALALPPLRRRAPRLLRVARAAASRAAALADQLWTAPAMRRLRRRAAPAFTIALAGPADADDIRDYDRARGRSGDEYLALAPGEFCVLARIEGRIAGCTHVLDPPWTRAAGVAGDFWIHDTHVPRRLRGLGIGLALSEAALAELRRRGANRVRVAVRAENRRSRIICDGLGFLPFGHLGGHDLLELALAPPK